ncbi:FIST N domain protein [Shimia sp. SK013]|uniref:FIST N-terminal domain-containing protein n=1 Tax=Shimia sp. SK013 TaxID=1389006 RepID=UPI0006B575BB|nr:FIST N-terminal domain-containing protein [Shimia sp. SK013]KPA21632.1 FIST N domain protein [Shimia sp. SK013]
MDGVTDQSRHPVQRKEEAAGLVRRGFAPCEAPDAIDRLVTALGHDPLALVILFLSPQTPLPEFLRSAKGRFGAAQVVGCTTAGELGAEGYTEGEIVAIGFPQAHFAASTLLIDDLNDIRASDRISQMIQNRNALAASHPAWQSEFAFLMVDGLSLREDALANEIALGLGPVPLFGGSAGDGEDFEQTYVIQDDQIHDNAAILVQVRSNCPVRVFKTDHLQPTDARMVVTAADPAKRLVHNINAEPAAREYARILGKDPEQLSTFTFAAHPVVVRIGDQTHVRAIQRVAENGDLVFFSAIDEGMVLTLAEPEDMVAHLDRELSALSGSKTPDMILGCDCLLRRVEATQKQMTTGLSEVMARHNVVGFSTYGEQVNSMHVNQTFTGVAIYPPEST